VQSHRDFNPTDSAPVYSNSTATVITCSVPVVLGKLHTHGAFLCDYILAPPFAVTTDELATPEVITELTIGPIDNDDDNIVEFRSLPPRIESLSDIGSKVRVSPTAAAYAESKRGRTIHVESRLEEEPE
jgi:hypothetical protein